MIDWAAFVVVFIAAFLGATVIVSTYALGIRLLTISGTSISSVRLQSSARLRSSAGTSGAL